MSKQREKMTPPVAARIGLSLGLVVILAAMIGGFYFAYTMLRTTAEEVAEVQEEAQKVEAKVNNLSQLDKQLEKYKNSVEKAQQIVAESQSYQYQNQIIQDITFYANQAGVPVTGFTFTNGSTGAGSTTSANNTKTTAGAGPKSVMVSVQLGDKVGYMELLRFMHLIEQNLTRMQISSINLSKSDEAGKVLAQTLNVEVYVR